MKIRVSELIVKYLEQLGIEYIFGMPGAHILPVYDSLYDSGINSILVKHEQGASFMAGGYARASGKIGACITTAGPGATNLVTGIANAYADKQPVLIITGETSTHIFGKGGLQESSGEGGTIDQVSLFKGITKYNKIVERTDYLANVLNQASSILLSENAGPVLLSFPFNVQNEWVDDSIMESVLIQKRDNAGYLASSQIEAFSDLLKQSEHPIIVAGYGCIRANAQEQVNTLCELMGIPVTSSLKGKGVVSEDSKYSLGSLGVTSYSAAHEYILNKSDLVVFLGASFNERTSYVWEKNLLANKKIVQVDIDSTQLEKVFKADVAISGDIKDVVTGVLASLKKKGVQAKKFEKTRDYLDTLENEAEEGTAGEFKSRFPLIEKFFKKLEQKFPRDIMLFDDNIIFSQNFFHVSADNRYYPNSGISSLGHAIPAAIGARFAENKMTFAILGDGGFQMCCMEIMTAVNYQLPITIVMFNNATMGLIRKNQFQQYDKRFINCDFINPDYKALAESFGIQYFKVETEQDVSSLFEKSLSDSINLIEVMIDKDLFPNYVSKR